MVHSRPAQPMVIVDGPGEPITVIAARNYGQRSVRAFMDTLARDQKCGQAKIVAPGVLSVSGYPLKVATSSGVAGAKVSTEIAGARIADIARVILASIPLLTVADNLEILDDKRNRPRPSIELGVAFDADAHVGDSTDLTIARLNRAGNEVCARLAGQMAYRFDVSGWPYARVNLRFLKAVDEQWWDEFFKELITAFNVTIRRIAAPHEFP